MPDEITWTIQKPWNEKLLEKRTDPKPRDYIRASEIGSAYLDRYYRMKGEPITNPFPARVLRIFETGNIFEAVAKLAFLYAGYFKSTQTEVRIPGNVADGVRTSLDVVGHLDIIGGGKRDRSQADTIKALFKALGLEFRLLEFADHIVDELEAKYPDGLPELLYEVKSINSMVFWKHQRNSDDSDWLGYPHHRLQLYTYLKGAGMKEGRILYISKDDLTLHEVKVIADEELEKQWQTDIQTMSKYYLDDLVPPREPDVVWNADSRKFEGNWKIARSGYFDKIVGLDEETYGEEVKKLVNRLNYRVKKVLKEHPDVEDMKIRAAIQPYLENELAKIYGTADKVVVTKPIVIQHAKPKTKAEAKAKVADDKV